jgi:hypothetical protein
MSARIPLSWLLLIVLLAVFVFFGYHIIQASGGGNSEKFPPYSERDARLAAASGADGADEAPADPSGGPHVPAADAGTSAGPTVDRTPPHAMPDVPGQTEEDLRTPEPLQRTPPTTELGPPEHADPMNRTVHMEAEFGSNFRHPEQMIEARPGSTMQYVTPSGLGSEHSSSGGHDAAMYAPEMAQNGGQFMRGIEAWDSSDGGGIAYSAI